MDNYGTFIGIVCLLAFMLPILFLVAKDQKKVRLLKNRIDTIAQKNHMNNSEMFELGNLIFLINHLDHKGIVFPRIGSDTSAVSFDRTKLDQVAASYETERLESGKTIISKIVISIKSGAKQIQYNAFDEFYPNQMEATSLVEKTKTMIHRIQKL
ncbi:hypothetical protein SAMN05216480_10161 [Pustulibacterium marinum]|uniref:Uncharacterized protein n=1 Tax=Pustulibacterium marinum TaxID=1224947 RepID=A0A1I7ET37_9FLAO|nr:hypothetical protein [Pustulibacterium marinum]SFU27081.1 hypothetical protein SAMN05216480_10161 [Pustulibacterium marinum]